ncbi:MAG: DUF4349 domain-containing protein [Bacteroidetes bacterium]|nr:DUF4349 domain-containing protein [Bacteroidota bacterium]
MKVLQLMTLTASAILFSFACTQHKNEAEKTLSQDVKVEEIKAPSAHEDNKNERLFIANADTAIAENQQLNEEKFEEKRNAPEQNASAKQKKDWDKKIVKTASLGLEVKDYSAFNQQLHETVKQFGGYIAQEEQNQSAYQIENKVSIKIPAHQFEDAVSKLTLNSERIIERKISSEDVTTEMIDTKSRIEAKKEVRQRYLELLKQAKNMKDILEVQNEINEIQEQLESAAGRLAYLGHSSAFSTINLTFYQVTGATAVSEKEPTYLYKMNEAFSNGLKWVSNLILGLVALWPLLIGIAVLFIIYKRRKNFKAKPVNAG